MYEVETNSLTERFSTYLYAHPELATIFLGVFKIGFKKVWKLNSNLAHLGEGILIQRKPMKMLEPKCGPIGAADSEEVCPGSTQP